MAGFTLIEALVVLAIVALVVGIAFPRFEGAIERRRQAEARAALALAVAEARGDAIAGATTVRLGLSGTTLQFSSARTPVELPDGVRLAWPADGVRFGADGTGSGGEGALETGARVTGFRIEPLGGHLRFAR